MAITIKKVRDLPPNNPTQVQTLYHLSQPITYGWDNESRTEFVVVSALSAAFDTHKPETFIFPADEQGEIVDFSEMQGSQRGTTDHATVIAAAGWEMVS